MIDLIKYPIIKEKSCRQIEENKYTFNVDKKLTKPQIKKILENLFKINIISVNTHLPPKKKKRLGLKQGYKARYKRVIIKIRSNQQIPVFGIENK